MDAPTAKAPRDFDGLGSEIDHQSLAILGMGSRLGRVLSVGYPTVKKEYYVKNHQGSVMALVDAYGIPSQAMRYSPYGVQSNLLVSSSSPLPEEQCEVLDPNTGLRKVYQKGDVIISKNAFYNLRGKLDASNVYQSVVHESRHTLYNSGVENIMNHANLYDLNSNIDLQHAQIFRDLRRDEYCQFFTSDVKYKIFRSYSSMLEDGAYEMLSNRGVY